MDDTTEKRIDWASAEIDDGALSVRLQGAKSKQWARRFDSVVTVLHHGGSEWGEIVLHKRTITVSAVQEGSEADLRHLLESAVLQANSESGDDARQPSGPQRHDQDALDRAASDRRMTDVFRSFADAALVTDRAA